MATKTKAKPKPLDGVTVPDDAETLLSRKQIAKAMGIGLRTFTRMLAERRFPGPDLRIGDLAKWRISTYNAWVASQGKGAA